MKKIHNAGLDCWSKHLSNAFHKNTLPEITDDCLFIDFLGEDEFADKPLYFGASKQDHKLIGLRKDAKDLAISLGISTPETIAIGKWSDLQDYCTSNYMIKCCSDYQPNSITGDKFTIDYAGGLPIDGSHASSADFDFFVEPRIFIDKEYEIDFVIANGNYEILTRFSVDVNLEEEDVFNKFICTFLPSFPQEVEKFIVNYLDKICPLLTGNAGHNVQFFKGADGNLYLIEHQLRFGYPSYPAKYITTSIDKIFEDVAKGLLPNVETIDHEIITSQ